VSNKSLRPAVHARITSDVESGWVATCEEIAVVTQGETLDEVTANLREAVALHLEGEDLATLGYRYIGARSARRSQPRAMP
jgi:predicted RNase H-like HicB family nuclease